MGLFSKKKQEPASEKRQAGIVFQPFVLAIPEEWNCVMENGTLRASNNDEIRLSVSIRDMSQVPDFSLENLFETVKAGYFNSDVNWGAYSAVTKSGNIIYQTLEYLDDPRLVIAAAGKVVNGRQLALIFSLAGNSGKEVETHTGTFIKILENIEVL